MTQIIAITNQKGGVGKTTTTINLAASLVAMKRKVLVVDLDPQGNTTMGSGVAKNELDLSIYDVLTAGCDSKAALISKTSAGYDLLPANGDLTAAEVELTRQGHQEKQLKQSLASFQEGYHYVFIDCPPALNILTVNALVAAEQLLIPMQCEYYALEGLAALINTVTQLQQSINPTLKICGLIRTMFDPRNSLTLDVSEQLHEHFGSAVFSTVIPRNVRLAEAPSHGLPALKYDKSSKGALAYLTMAGELVRRLEGSKTP